MPGAPPTSRPMPSPRKRQTTGSSGTFQVPLPSTVTRVPWVGGVSLSYVGAVMRRVPLVGRCRDSTPALGRPRDVLIATEAAGAVKEVSGAARGGLEVALRASLGVGPFEVGGDEESPPQRQG